MGHLLRIIFSELSCVKSELKFEVLHYTTHYVTLHLYVGLHTYDFILMVSLSTVFVIYGNKATQIVVQLDSKIFLDITLKLKAIAKATLLRRRHNIELYGCRSGLRKFV